MKFIINDIKINETIIEKTIKNPAKTYCKIISYYVIFPEISLCGNWLENIGFNYGNFVTIEHQQNKIIITTNNEIETK